MSFPERASEEIKLSRTASIQRAASAPNQHCLKFLPSAPQGRKKLTFQRAAGANKIVVVCIWGTEVNRRCVNIFNLKDKKINIFLTNVDFLSYAAKFI